MSRRPHPVSLRPILSGAAATAGLAFGLGPLTGLAQTAPAGTGTTSQTKDDSIVLDAVDDSIVLDAVTVKGETADAATAAGNVNATPMGNSRLPETVRETPRVVNVVPAQIIDEQKATSLEQALRNVPGITMSSGEGRGGQIGDQFRIRGLNARGDIYTNGLKDFGVYTHDVFATEAVQVIKGPSGEGFGVGNSGGVINQVTKQAHPGRVNKIEQSWGSDSTLRTTADVNQQIDATTALRVNALYHDQDDSYRDNVSVERKGLAADLGLGLGTDTTWHLNYMYMHGDQDPDQGQPMVRGGDGLYRPAGEYGMNRSTSYVRNLDHDISENHVVTSNLSHQFDDRLAFYNDTRWSQYSRDFAITAPAGLTSVAGLNGALSYGAGGGMAYQQDGWGVQNVSGLKAEGTFLGLRHKANGGLDLSYQEDTRHQGTWLNRTNTQRVLNPSHSYNGNTSIYYPDSGIRSSSVENVGAYATDRVWLADRVSVQGGLRWDYFRTAFRSADPAIANGKDIARTWSPSASVIVEPTPDSSVYATYSRSYKPVGTDIAAAVTLGTSETPNQNNDMDPEQTDLWELGGKADFLGGKLGLSGAVFIIDKTNSYSTGSDGTVTDGFAEAGLGTRIKGFETGISGKVTPSWSVFANYALLTGEVTASQSNPSLIGNSAPYVPKHNANLWTTYVLSDLIGDVLPGKLTAGGGIQYASEYWDDSANSARMPETVSLDSMLSYQYDKMRLSLNGYNLTDHRNYSSGFSTSRAVPAAGRTFMLTAGMTF